MRVVLAVLLILLFCSCAWVAASAASWFAPSSTAIAAPMLATGPPIDIGPSLASITTFSIEHGADQPPYLAGEEPTPTARTGPMAIAVNPCVELTTDLAVQYTGELRSYPAALANYHAPGAQRLEGSIPEKYHTAPAAFAT